MRRGLIIAVAAVAAAMLGFGCRPANPADDGESETTGAVSPVLAVTAVPVKVAPMRSELDILGTVAALRHVTLRAPAAGRVLGLNLQSGDPVRRGQVVARVLSREVEAAQAGLAVAEKIDPQEADTLGQSVRRYSGGAGIAVVAPENAVVAQRLVSSGQTVNYLDPLADLIDPASVYVEAALPIDDVHLVTPGMSATVSSPLRPGTDFPARVAALSPSLNENSVTTPARLQFTGTSRLATVGAPVEVRITTAYVPEAIVVPASALFRDAAGSGYYVFVAGDDRRAHRTAVTVGMRNQDEAQITRGLKPRQLVIITGGYALSDGLEVRAAVAQQ